MTCPSRSIDDDTIHAYVAGTLPESETEAFEQHMLGCAGCRDAVRLGAGVRAALASSPARRRLRPRVVAAAALMLAAASIVLVMVRPRSDRGAAAFTPPAFNGLAVRGGADADSAQALADHGMAAYQRGDYAAAARLLDEATQRAESPGVSFYLAAARMATGNDSGALRAARRAALPAGNPFAADAAVIAAKAWLRIGRSDSAVAELDRAPRDGPGSAHAAALLDSVRRGRP